MRPYLLLLGVLGVLGGAWWFTRPAPPDPLVEIGRRIFVEGRLPDGRPTTAKAYGDVVLSGDQVSCASCHGRSGMGAAETGTRTPPITAPMLFNPAQRPEGPIYGTALMGRALRQGIDSSGKVFSPLMPRYELSDADVEALVHYLRTLYAEDPPGLDEHHVYFATVMSEEAPADAQNAVLSVLNRVMEDHNSDFRNAAGRDRSRIEAGRTRKLYREWSLDTWMLKGDPEDWGAQLDRYMEKQPVFGMVSGLSTRSWESVGEFCENHQIPCLFPSVDRAPVKEGDFYTLYFSDGPGTEARVILKELLSLGAIQNVVQVVTPAARPAAQWVEDGLKAAGGDARMVAPSDRGAIEAAMGGAAKVVVFWVGKEDAAQLPEAHGPLVYFSGSFLGDTKPEIPFTNAWVVASQAPPTSRDAGLLRFRAWASGRGLAITHERLQAQAWFAATSLVDSMEHTAAHPGGTYLLDTLDHATGLAALIPGFPQGEFGPGQRVISKGAWIIPLDISASTRWVIP